MIIGQSLATAAGICAALASIFAKLAMASHAVVDLCHGGLQTALNSSWSIVNYIYIPTLEENSVTEFCSSASLVIRLLCFGLVFASNAVMWTLFVRSLQSTLSVVATVTSTASNFFFSGISGYIIFGEVLPVMWWFGAGLILLGLLLMNLFSSSHVSEKSSDLNSEKKKQPLAPPHVDKEKLI